MTNLIEWFLGTNDYLTRYHCLQGDNLMILIGILIDALIIVLYSTIAFVAYCRFRKAKHSIAVKLWLSMVIVFVFCAFCGYGSSIALTYYPIYRAKYLIQLLVLAPASFLLLYMLFNAAGKEAFQEMKRGAKYKKLDDLVTKVNLKVLETNIEKSVKSRKPLSQKDLELVKKIVVYLE